VEPNKSAAPVASAKEGEGPPLLLGGEEKDTPIKEATLPSMSSAPMAAVLD
jgi:hypothetical protein